MSANKSLLIIGVGNPLRCDDGAGPAVVAALSESPLAETGVTLQVHHGEGLSLLEAWQGYSKVIIIDATRSDKPPGTIQHFEVNKNTTLPRDCFHASSHLFGVAEAVALAQSLGKLPASMEVYGIEGENFAYGERLSSPVQKAVAQVVNNIRALV